MWKNLIVVVAVVLGGPSSVEAGTNEPGYFGLHIDSTSSMYSIEARKMTLPRVLEAVGAEVGFKVVDTFGEPRPPIDFVIKNAPFDKVLRQLLAEENYAIIPANPGRGGQGAGQNIGTIFLLGSRPTEKVMANREAERGAMRAKMGEGKGNQALEDQAPSIDVPVFGRTSSVRRSYRDSEEGRPSGSSKKIEFDWANPPKIPEALSQQAMQRIQALRKSLEQARQQVEASGQLP